MPGLPGGDGRKAAGAARRSAGSPPRPDRDRRSASGRRGRAVSLTQPSFGATPISRWLTARVWRLEHAFERARASGKAEDDTRIRIFFVLALFAAGLITLAIGAAHA